MVILCWGVFLETDRYSYKKFLKFLWEFLRVSIIDIWLILLCVSCRVLKVYIYICIYTCIYIYIHHQPWCSIHHLLDLLEWNTSHKNQAVTKMIQCWTNLKRGENKNTLVDIFPTLLRKIIKSPYTLPVIWSWILSDKKTPAFHRCFGVFFVFFSWLQNRVFWGVKTTTMSPTSSKTVVMSPQLHGGVFLPDVFSFTTLLGAKSDSDTAWRRAIVVLEQMEEKKGVDGPGPEKNLGGLGGSSF